MLSLFLGPNGGMRRSAMEGFARRNQWSDFLPYHAYDEAQERYYNADDTWGYLWECTPLTFSGMDSLRQLQSFLGVSWPKGSTIQFILYADPNIKPFVERFKACKTRPGKLVQRSVEEFSRFLFEGVQGLEKNLGIPVRNFRLFIAVKTSRPIDPDHLASAEDTLKTLGVQPRHMAPRDLLEWLRRLFNTYEQKDIRIYNDALPIRRQILFAETDIDVQRNQTRIWERYWRCITPMTLPERVDTLKTNRLTGDAFDNNTDQLPNPFLWTLTVLMDDPKNDIHRKAALTMAQKATGTFAVEIGKRVKEFTWALDVMGNDRFMRVIPSLWIIGDTEEAARVGVARAKSLWSSEGYTPQEETVLQQPLLLSALPFGFRNTPGNLRVLDRDFVVHSRALAQLLPVQADFSGGSPRPVITLVGRKGQVIGLDLRDPRTNNFNFLIAAETGGGKSFFLNDLVSNYYGTGSLVRITDLGGSYKKKTQTVGGRYLQFSPRNPICINPFTSMGQDPEDREKDIDEATVSVLGAMVYAGSGQHIAKTEQSLLQDAARFAVARDGGQYGVDHVYEYLSQYPKLAQSESHVLHHFVEHAHEMAFNLREFTKHGPYGHFFNGPSTFNIQADPFVVLEMEELKANRSLLVVVTMQIFNAVTQELYLSDRTGERFILFDEAWNFLKGNQGAVGNHASRIIEEGYRRARKYGGSFGIVTQSLHDLTTFGDVGAVINANAKFKFLMESSKHEEAVRQGVVDYTAFDVKLLNTLRNATGKYSEIFLDTPFGKGVARLIVDPWTYWVNTSASHEVAAFEALLKEGQDPIAALEQLAGVR